MTRHFYDLEKLMDTDYGRAALADLTLYHEIVEHRRKFYHVGYVDYDKELLGAICIVPSAGLRDAYAADYEEMRGSFIYGEALEFEVLMERMRELEGRFRAVRK